MTQSEIRERVTGQIVEALRAGTPPWRKPWSDLENVGPSANAVSRRPYRGINPLLLELAAAEHGYRSRWWGTYRQWLSLGCRVRERPSDVPPGGWGTRVILYKPVTRTAVNEDGEPEVEEFLILRQFTVFNAEQCLDSERFLARPRTGPAVPDYEPAEQAIRATGADIRHGGDRAVYRKVEDFIQVPVRRSFDNPHAYYGTIFHEVSHWTGHENRLDRLDRNARFGDAAYAFEELVAEISGCFLSTELGIPQADDLSNQQAYIASWLQVLRADHRAIFAAAAQASAAADYILSFSRPQAATEEDAHAA